LIIIGFIRVDLRFCRQRKGFLDLQPRYSKNCGKIALNGVGCEATISGANLTSKNYWDIRY
jgi:hypothetical protein